MSPQVAPTPSLPPGASSSFPDYWTEEELALDIQLEPGMEGVDGNSSMDSMEDMEDMESNYSTTVPTISPSYTTQVRPG